MSTKHTTHQDSGKGILEERNESHCSSQNKLNVLSTDCCDSIYPKLKANGHNTRSSCQFADADAKGAKLEPPSGTWKMPPVSSAVTAKRQRKLSSQNEDGPLGGFRIFNGSSTANASGPVKTSSVNIHESQ